MRALALLLVCAAHGIAGGDQQLAGPRGEGRSALQRLPPGQGVPPQLAARLSAGAATANDTCTLPPLISQDWSDMTDATGRTPWDLGNYDLCQASPTRKYCILRAGEVWFGVCIPSSCGPDDVRADTNGLLLFLEVEIPALNNLDPTDADLTCGDFSHRWSAASIAATAVIGSLVALVLVGTALEAHDRRMLRKLLRRARLEAHIGAQAVAAARQLAFQPPIADGDGALASSSAISIAGAVGAMGGGAGGSGGLSMGAPSSSFVLGPSAVLDGRGSLEAAADAYMGDFDGDLDDLDEDDDGDDEEDDDPSHVAASAAAARRRGTFLQTLRQRRGGGGSSSSTGLRRVGTALVYPIGYGAGGGGGSNALSPLGGGGGTSGASAGGGGSGPMSPLASLASLGGLSRVTSPPQLIVTGSLTASAVFGGGSNGAGVYGSPRSGMGGGEGSGPGTTILGSPSGMELPTRGALGLQGVVNSASGSVKLAGSLNSGAEGPILPFMGPDTLPPLPPQQPKRSFFSSLMGGGASSAASAGGSGTARSSYASFSGGLGGGSGFSPLLGGMRGDRLVSASERTVSSGGDDRVSPLLGGEGGGGSGGGTNSSGGERPPVDAARAGSRLRRLLKACSLRLNVVDLCNTRGSRSGEAAVTNGIRVLSFALFILGNSLLYQTGVGFINLSALLPPSGALASVPFQVFPSAEFAADTFFVLSAFFGTTWLLKRWGELAAKDAKAAAAAGGDGTGGEGDGSAGAGSGAGSGGSGATADAAASGTGPSTGRRLLCLPATAAAALLRRAGSASVWLRRGGVYLLRRAFRLLPAYAAVLATFTLVLPLLSSGPFWYRMDEVTKACSTYWWANLSFTHNFFPAVSNNPQECMGWTWYLAVDMQLHFLVPLAVRAHMVQPLLATALVVLLLVGSLVLGGCIASANALSPLFAFSFGYDSAYLDLYYTKPWTRAPPFLIGILVAFAWEHVAARRDAWAALRQTSATAAAAPTNALGIETYAARPRIEVGRMPFKASPWRQAWLQAAAVALMGLVFFAPASNYAATTASSTTQGAGSGGWSSPLLLAYTTGARAAWGLGIAVFLLLGLSQRRNLITRVLALPLWQPLSKLSYSSFLIGPAVMQVVYYSQTGFFRYSPVSAVAWACSAFFLSFLGGLVVYLLIERPARNLTVLTWAWARAAVVNRKKGSARCCSRVSKKGGAGGGGSGGGTGSPRGLRVGRAVSLFRGDRRSDDTASALVPLLR